MKKLQEGSLAPDFTVTDVNGEKIRLSAHTEGYILLAFLRYAGCPWCNLAVHRLAMESAMLGKNNCEVIAFVQSDKDSIQQNIYERHAVRPQFSIIADPDKTVYTKYGVGNSLQTIVKGLGEIPAWVHAVKDHGFAQSKMDGSLFLAPGMFLIEAKTRRVKRAFYNKNFFEHETFTPLYETLVYRS